MSDTFQPAPPQAIARPLGPYRHEHSLFVILSIFAVLFWILLTLVTFGIVWIYLAFFYLFFLAGHSALISHLKGNAVRISEQQFPELHAQLLACCAKVGIKRAPEAYLMSGNGILNAFATRFLSRYYVVLLSDVVDALASDQEGINFYLGHELAHVARKHVANSWWLAPVKFMPLVGTAYRRAQEYTCDQYGAACCENLSSASHAMAVLAAGTHRWQQLDAQAFIAQTKETSGFWMSLNELTGEYPWLCKRMARLHDPKAETPRRHPLAWFFAFCLPSSGPGGLILSLFLFFCVIGMLAAISIPAYQQYQQRAAYPEIFSYGETLKVAVQDYYEKNGELAEEVESLGLTGPQPAAVGEVTLDPSESTVRLSLLNGKTIVETAEWDDDGHLTGWSCLTDVLDADIPKGVSCESVTAPEPNPFERLFER